MEIISEKEFNYYPFYQRICYCLEKLKDYNRELKAIKLYYTNPPIQVSEYSDKWFTDVNEKGYRTDWRYVYIRGRCPHCGKLNLLNYYTESREYDAD